jgi:hypothetical protein
MTKKHINIALIILVLVIWGSIGYTYFVKDEVVQNTIITASTITPKQYTIHKDTFELKEIKNPFQSVFVSSKKSASKVVSKNTKTPKKIVPTMVKWPDIKYHGYVLSKGSSRKLGVIKINGKIMKKREQDIVLENFKIKRIYEDSIQFIHNKNIKTIKKQ